MGRVDVRDGTARATLYTELDEFFFDNLLLENVPSMLRRVVKCGREFL